MPYRFKINEPVEKGFRRIAREQFDSSIAELAGPTADPKSVHECRKSIKRLRALIRLTAATIGTKKARRRTKALGEIGRLLSARRDQTVMFETIEKLAQEFPEAGAAFAPLKATLTARAGNQPERLDAETADRARGLLGAEAKKIERLDFKHQGFAALAGGLDTSYRKARKAIAYAYDEPTDENFHELRKAVQWHWRQMALLARAWPDEFAVRVNASRELSQWLGDDHDLAVLAAAVSAAPDMTDEQKEAAISICRMAAAGSPRKGRISREAAILRKDAGLHQARGGILGAWPGIGSAGRRTISSAAGSETGGCRTGRRQWPG